MVLVDGGEVGVAVVPGTAAGPHGGPLGLLPPPPGCCAVGGGVCLPQRSSSFRPVTT